MKIKTKEGIKRELDLLKFCVEQNFLFPHQVKWWLFQNYSYANLESARGMSKKLLKNLEKARLIEMRPSQYARRKKANVTSKGLDLLVQNGLLSPSICYRPLDDRQESHDTYVTDVRLAWEKCIKPVCFETERLVKVLGEEQIPDFYFDCDFQGKIYRFANEVELTQKSESRYQKIFSYYQESSYKCVFYYVLSESLKTTLLNISKDFTNKLLVCNIEEFLESPAGVKVYSNFGEHSFQKIFDIPSDADFTKAS